MLFTLTCAKSMQQHQWGFFRRIAWRRSSCCCLSLSDEVWVANGERVDMPAVLLLQQRMRRDGDEARFIRKADRCERCLFGVVQLLRTRRYPDTTHARPQRRWRRSEGR